MKIKGYKILELGDIYDEIGHLHKHGWDTGVYCGFPNVDKHYSMMEGSCTDWTGYPQHGKTELMLEFQMFTSLEYGWQHLLCVPDIGKSIEVMAKLIHKHTGLTFKKKYKNYIDIETAYKSSSFLLHHFKILHKTEPKARLNPVEFWDFACELKIKNQELKTATIDSWKDLKHDYNGRGYAVYLSDVLPIRNELAEQSKLHFHTVIHPKNPVRDKNRLKYPPDTDDMEGGAQWNNNGKCILSVFRENFDSKVTDLYFRKIKPESVGFNSSTPVCLEFDVIKSRYYYLDDLGNKQFASKKQLQNKPVQMNFLEPIKVDDPF